MDEIPFEVNREFIKAFVLNGQEILNNLKISEDLFETEEPKLSL